VEDSRTIYISDINPRYEEPQYCNYLKRYKVRWLDGVFQVSESGYGVFRSFSPLNIYINIKLIQCKGVWSGIKYH
jgi:hypothetical protein